MSALIEFLSNIDTRILLIFNSYHTHLLDKAMWTVSDRYVWIPLYVIIALYVLKRYSWYNGLFIITFICLSVGAADFICASLIRPEVARLRPSNPDNPIYQLLHLVNGYRGGRYGFPSCHAANTMALAIFISLLLKSKKVTVIIIAWSLVVSGSRLYLGVHYPSDVLGGWFIGIMMGLTGYYCYCKTYHYFINQSVCNLKK